MEKIRDLFKKIRDTKRIFLAKMGKIKDKNGIDLTEEEDIKNRWQEYTEEPYKKDLNHTDNHDGVITHWEPDIQEWEVKWALGSIVTNKASGGDGIPVELFQIKKWWCCESAALNTPANLENSEVATRLEMLSFLPIPKKTNANFSKLGFNSVWIEKLQMFNLDLEKAEEPEIKLPSSVRS